MINCCNCLFRLEAKFGVWTKDHLQYIQNQVYFLATNEGLKARNKLIQARQIINANKQLEEGKKYYIIVND